MFYITLDGIIPYNSVPYSPIHYEGMYQNGQQIGHFIVHEDDHHVEIKFDSEDDQCMNINFTLFINPNGFYEVEFFYTDFIQCFNLTPPSYFAYLDSRGIEIGHYDKNKQFIKVCPTLRVRAIER